MGLNEGKKWKIREAAVGCMDAVPAIRPVVTRVIPPLYPLSHYDELLDKAFMTFDAKNGSRGVSKN